MAAAFASSKFDDYQDRVREVDRTVVLRYRFYEPEEVLLEAPSAIPTYASWDLQQFASSLIGSAKLLEQQGHSQAALDKYWSIARFGQLLGSRGNGYSENWASNALQAAAYRELEIFSHERGNRSEPEAFGYLATKFDPGNLGKAQFEGRVFIRYICAHNARSLQIATLLSVLFSGLLITAVLTLVFGWRPAESPAARRGQARASVLALASAICLLLSFATIYLTYRPYWYIFQSAVLSGNRSHLADLEDFLLATQTLPGGRLGSELPFHLPFYFWTAVTLSGIAGLIFVFLRHLRTSTLAKGLQHQPRAH